MKNEADMITGVSFAVGVGAVAGIAAKLYGWSTLAATLSTGVVGGALLYLIAKRMRSPITD